LLLGKENINLQWQRIDFTKAAENQSLCQRVLTSGDLGQALYFILFGMGMVFGTGHIPNINR
jgi:hypothetical protein